MEFFGPEGAFSGDLGGLLARVRHLEHEVAQLQGQPELELVPKVCIPVLHVLDRVVDSCQCTHESEALTGIVQPETRDDSTSTVGLRLPVP
jgi:hypothetical protein